MLNPPHIIIDGYNYILRQSLAEFSQDNALWQARERLIHQMTAYLGQKQIRITIVFDGQDLKSLTKVHRPAGLDVLFSKTPQKADPLIIRLVEKSPSPRTTTVVTSDLALTRHVKSFGCETLTVEAFSNKITSESAKETISKKFGGSMSANEVQEWMQLFGEDQERDE